MDPLNDTPSPETPFGLLMVDQLHRMDLPLALVPREHERARDAAAHRQRGTQTPQVSFAGTSGSGCHRAVQQTRSGSAATRLVCQA